jgi:HPr kinase/phosphorylase
MQIHGSCASRDGAGVLLLGPPGAGKSDLLLRLIDRGFLLVADDRVDIEDGVAAPTESLAGLIEVRGLGILRMPYVAQSPLRLCVRLTQDAGTAAARLPQPTIDPTLATMGLSVPAISLDPTTPAAALKVELALRCVVGDIQQVVGAFGP